MAKERHTAAFVVGMVVGGAAGAAITLWKTPLSGAQVRARIAETAESVKQQVVALGERLGIELGEPEPAPAALPVIPPSETEPIPSMAPTAVGVPLSVPPSPDPAPTASAAQPGFAAPSRESPSTNAATGPPLTPNV